MALLRAPAKNGTENHFIVISPSLSGAAPALLSRTEIVYLLLDAEWMDLEQYTIAIVNDLL